MRWWRIFGRIVRRWDDELINFLVEEDKYLA
jgi:hypothetical protein